MKADVSEYINMFWMPVDEMPNSCFFDKSLSSSLFLSSVRIFTSCACLTNPSIANFPLLLYICYLFLARTKLSQFKDLVNIYLFHAM